MNFTEAWNKCFEFINSDGEFKRSDVKRELLDHLSEEMKETLITTFIQVMWKPQEERRK